jgi:AraC family transcriptional regulator, transcriptional activator of the genes for pyochelin and ferripyochelin receptors
MSRLYLKDLINFDFNCEKNIIKNSFPFEIGSDYM